MEYLIQIGLAGAGNLKYADDPEKYIMNTRTQSILKTMGNILYTSKTMNSIVLQTDSDIKDIKDVYGVQDVKPVQQRKWKDFRGKDFISWEIVGGYEDWSLSNRQKI